MARYTLYLGDCLSWMEKREKDSIHAIVTDPPYGLKEYTSVELDPFMGGGSTIAAALAVGYESIGIESDPVFYRMAEHAIAKLAELGGEAKPSLTVAGPLAGEKLEYPTHHGGLESEPCPTSSAASPPATAAVRSVVGTGAQSGLDCGILHFNGLEEQALLRR